MVNKTKVAPQTKEQIEYEDAKKNFRIATAKDRLHSSGIDPSKISQQVVDKVIRIFDDMDHVQQDNQQKVAKAQQDAEAKIQKLNQDANQKFAEIQKRYQDLVNSLQNVTVSVSQEDAQAQDGTQPTVQVQEEAQPDVQAVPLKEEVVERTREDIVAYVTEKLLSAFMPFMKGPIEEKVSEFMSTLDQKTSDIVIKAQDGQKDVPKEEPAESVPTVEVRKVVSTEEQAKSVP
jgi:hypothetical protein